MIAIALEGERGVEVLGLAIVLFASTNVDDLFVLVAFFVDPGFRPREIVAGQYIGIAFLFAVGLTGSLLSFVIPRAYIGLLGLVAIVLGTKRLWDNIPRRGAEKRDLASLNSSGKYPRSTAVALITLANGSDNVGVYMPAFAADSGFQIVIFGTVFFS
jgi:cadmium resistance protein CadD (predicted permease)